MPNLELTLCSSSMAPTIVEGQTVWSTPTAWPSTGQVVVIPRGTIYVVHRLVLRFPPPFSCWGLERGDKEKYPRLLHLENLSGVVVFPDLPPSPTRRSPQMELYWWGKSMGGTLLQQLKRCSFWGTHHAGT